MVKNMSVFKEKIKFDYDLTDLFVDAMFDKAS